MFDHASYNQSFLAAPGQNDAAQYGVFVGRPGGALWRCIGVHHLTGAENVGNHNVYADVLDEEGKRIPGASVVVYRPGQPDLYAVVDKPDDEAGTNFPLWSQDVVSLGMADNVSDVVYGLKTAHPDEESGNTLFHHSFYVVFQRGVPNPKPPIPEPEPEPCPDLTPEIQRLRFAVAQFLDALEEFEQRT